MAVFQGADIVKRLKYETSFLGGRVSTTVCEGSNMVTLWAGQ